MAFAVNTAARLLLTPRNGGALTTRQASLNAADPQVASPNRAFDAGLRPGPFPDRAASLLPSLLAATRTGLTPAGDDELMLDQLLTQHLQLWAHARSGLAVRCARGMNDERACVTDTGEVRTQFDAPDERLARLAA